MASWDEINHLLLETIGSYLPEATPDAERSVDAFDLEPLRGEADAVADTRLLFATAFRDATMAGHHLRLAFLPLEVVLDDDMGDARINAFDVSLGMLSVVARAVDRPGTRDPAENSALQILQRCSCYPWRKREGQQGG